MLSCECVSIAKASEGYIDGQKIPDGETHAGPSGVHPLKKASNKATHRASRITTIRLMHRGAKKQVAASRTGDTHRKQPFMVP